MKNQENAKSEAKKLRHKAEEELQARGSLFSNLEMDKQIVIHELQVHQIELEMQNEELIIARNQAEAAMEKYIDLYDFAPFGYLSLSEDGVITDLNFSAAKMLGKDRLNLKNRLLTFYIHPDSLELFNKTIEKAFNDKTRIHCELFLISKTASKICVHVNFIVTDETPNLCLLNLVDITERKEMEQELLNKTKDLENMNRYFLDREMRMIELKHEINDLLLKNGCEKEYLI